VLPGAALLDAVLQVIQRERGIDPMQWHIASVKFIGAVRPGDALRLEHIVASNGGLIRFTVRAADRPGGHRQLVEQRRMIPKAANVAEFSAQGGLDQASRARQRRTAPHHGVRFRCIWAEL